jgi:hypothetical protein
LNEQDFTAFSAALGDLASLYGKAMQPTAVAMYFRALAAHSIGEVVGAMDAHVKDEAACRFFPLPGQLAGQIKAVQADDGRPGAEEAWAIAVAAQDERVTIVWTDEIAQAMASAKPIMDMGDEVGARMAFKEAYLRLVAEARQRRAPMQWVAALGHDEAGRASALREAAAKGRVVAGLDDLLALPAPRGSAPLLLEGPELIGMPDHIRVRLKAVRDQMTRMLDEPGMDAAEKARTEALKAAANQRVEAYTGGAV